MKNLKLLCHKWHKYVDVDSVRVITPLCDNVDEIIVSDHSKVFKINIVTEEFNLLFDLENEIPLPDARIVNIALFSVERIILCAANTGEVMRLDMDSLLIDAAGSFEKGIKAMQVSPDNEQLVFVTGDNKVILTDCRLEVINTVSLNAETFGDGEFMTVGWGKKETQFHGSEGKEAAKQKTVVEESGDDIKKDDVLVTWRGDGAMFAVGFCINSVFTFKVFDREVVLKFTSEKQPGIECSFAWRPSGNLIATTQQFPNKYVVAFFEKNGLKHGEFVLPFMKSDVSVKKLSWSADSEVLSVWCEETASRKSFLLNYTVNNYHWYLKQSLLFPADCSISAMAWDDSNSSGNGKLLHMFLNGGIYSQYNWVWCTDISTGKTEKDNALVGVIDGKNILLTSFRKAVVPPPMAAFTLKCNNNVNEIIFGPNSVIDNSSTEVIDSNSFIALLDDGSFNLYFAQNKSGSGFQLLGSTSLKENIQTPRTVSHFLWLANNTIMCISSNGSKSDLLLLKISCNDKFGLNLASTVPIADRIVGLSRITSTEAMLQTSSGKLFTFSEANGMVEYHFAFPECCYRFEVCSLLGESSVFLFGMTHRHRFYVNDKEVANNVNSFLVHSDFLLLTTLQHQLLCCPLSKDMNIQHFGSHFENKSVNNVNTTVSQRKLERGSELVTAVACGTRTVMQLPRGNIEAIQPRALSLKLIGNFLDKCAYVEAFDLMRKQRINLNLIHDHDPEKFTENIAMFITAIDNASWLSLFITDLENIDVTETMYASSYNRPKRNDNGAVPGKISLICADIMRYLQQDNERNKNALPILTARVKANTRLDLEGALLMIRLILLQPGKGDDETLISADEAMKYLLLLVDVNTLYDIALGLYDFDLVMFVASKSQKDPKEYVPYLNELKKMEPDYRKFTINKHLKRYDRALDCLLNYICNLEPETDVEKEKELMSFIKQHSLYKDALYVFSSEEHPLFQQCAEDFADYLIARRKYSEAGIMYKRGGHLQKAIDAFTEAADWQAVMNLVEDLNPSNEELQELRSKLMEKLKENKKYSDALELLSYSNNATPEELLSCALEGQMYRKALNICERSKSTDLIEGKLLDAVMEQYTVMMSTIKDKEEQFFQQRDRLQVVRKIKAETLETGEDLHEDCDLFSDTSSVANSGTSRSSRGSMRSSKNRRKHQRKLVSLKEGSRYEDIALVRSLHSLATTTFALRRDVSEINFVMQWLEKDSEVDDLQTRLEYTLKYMEMSFPQIWLPELSSITEVSANVSSNKPDDQNTTDDIDSQLTLEPHIRIAPVIQEIKWTVDLF